MSALTNEIGQIPMAYDPVRVVNGTPAFGTGMLIDASTEAAAFCGQVWHPTVKTGTIAIRKVHFNCGAIASFNAASEFRVSLQNVSATAGPPFQPDGGVDEFYNYGAGVSPTASGWNTTGNLSADRTVDLSADSISDANSRWLAVVFDYAAFTAATSVIIRGNDWIGGAAGGADDLLGGIGVLFTGSWALPGSLSLNSVIALECSDGTFAFLRRGLPFSAFGSASVASNGAIRRAGVKFKVPTQRQIDSLGLRAMIPNGCDGTWVLYDSDGTTPLRSVDVDNDPVKTQGASLNAEVGFEPVTLAADTYYRFVFVAGTTTAATIYYGDVNAVGIMDGFILGQSAHWTQHDGTNWSDTTTRRPHFGIGFSAFHDGAGGANRAALPAGVSSLG